MAWLAELKTEPQTANTRHAPRRRLQLDARVAASGETAEVRIHNISATGLLLETAISLAKGEAITIDLPEAGQRQATVVWQDGVFYGCGWSSPISTAALSAAQLRSPWRDTSMHGDAAALSAGSLSLRRKAAIIVSLALASWAVVGAAAWAIF